MLFWSPDMCFPIEQLLQGLHALTQLLLDAGDIFWSCWAPASALTSQHLLSALWDDISLLAAGFICFLQIDLLKAHLRSCSGKTKGFSQMVAGFCDWTKQSARFLLFECPCLSSQLVNPFPFSKLILPAGARTQNLLLWLLGSGKAEVPRGT